ncbi:hypothetical protein PWP93_17015 [Paraburkholderia sp. A1RI-2L]|uniref:hypothetical protein n=1 Tax=Paraburkholderia sp. A1RI-2L TaxID=3028367 RepID=UPI003B7975FD
MIARFLFVPLWVAALTGSVHAQAGGPPIPLDTPVRQYGGPLQQNLNTAIAPAATNPSRFDKRCRDLADSYSESFRSPGPAQSNAVVPNYGESGEQVNTMQAYHQRQDAEKAFRDAGCR